MLTVAKHKEKLYEELKKDGHFDEHVLVIQRAGEVFEELLGRAVNCDQDIFAVMNIARFLRGGQE